MSLLEQVITMFQLLVLAIVITLRLMALPLIRIMD